MARRSRCRPRPKTINSGIIGDGYLGAGARFDTHKGFALRLDARVAVLPGVDPSTGDNKLAFEGDIGFGLELTVGRSRAEGRGRRRLRRPTRTGTASSMPPTSAPTRPEDKDGFEDGDGCPDIDNDGDHVLDIADKCPAEPETMNGFDDDDGCPDAVPAEVDGLRGTIEGLLYADGETAVRDSAKKSLENIEKVMNAHPSIKVVLVGHTDDQEAKAFADARQASRVDVDSLNDRSRPRARRGGAPGADRAGRAAGPHRRRRRRRRGAGRRQQLAEGPAREPARRAQAVRAALLEAA